MPSLDWIGKKAVSNYHNEVPFRLLRENSELSFGKRNPLHAGFMHLVKQMAERGQLIDVDHLLIMQYLMRHKEIDTTTAATVSQRSAEQARELLSKLANNMGLIEPVGRGKGRYYALSRYAYELFKGSMTYERKQSLDKEAMKIRILSILRDRPLTNQEVRQLTGLDRKQVNALIHGLEGVKIIGHGRAAKYVIDTDN